MQDVVLILNLQVGNEVECLEDAVRVKVVTEAFLWKKISTTVSKINSKSIVKIR